MSIKQIKSEIELNIPTKFTCLICEKCGYEFIILYIMELRSSDEPIKLDYINIGKLEYCPHCGTDCR